MMNAPGRSWSFRNTSAFSGWVGMRPPASARIIAQASLPHGDGTLGPEDNPMKIVAADPYARVLTEDEVMALLREPIVMHLGMVDEKGWPVVNPVWHVFENGVFRIVIGTTSHKAKA